LKLLPASRTHDESARDLAEREARIVASLNHPNILALHDIGLQDGAMYLVTELIDGESLRGSTLTMRKSLDIAAQIADGLSAAHAAGVTHRDLKPDNVMVTRDGRVKLVDFGVAEVTPLPSDADATFSSEDVGVVAGTLGYMAPEQIRASEIDGRADIFSFGALLYELLSGTRAFSGETGADVITAILKADPPELPAGVPPLVREIVHRCLEKKREERFQSARDLAFAVRQAAAAIGVAPDTTGTVAGGAPSAAAVRGHLTKLLSSPRLVNAERLSSLLRFIVEETLNGRGPQLKEARIGLDVLGRSAGSYDPAIDPIVRVQMGRLRAKLRAYYTSEGAGDQLRIEIPVGSYIPIFGIRVTDGQLPVRTVLPAPPPSDDLRIAVLPIVNMSADAENDYFCDGLTEELINRLAQTRGLRVVARTSSFQFKDAARDIREVGRLLDVSKVLEGSVRKAGHRIRVTVQLINVGDGCHLWSERYEGDLTDIFTIQAQISTAIQQALQMQMLGAEDTPAPRVQPQALEAYNHYLQGRFLWKKRTEQGLRAALDHFERAARIDPTFARALSGVADCHLLLGMSSAEAPEHCMPKAADAARKALQLDDALAEAPLSPPIIADLALVHAFREDFKAAEMYCRRALELDAHFHRPFWFLGLSAAWAGNFEAAEEALKRGLELCHGAAFRSRLLGALGFVYGLWGKPQRARRVHRELDQMRDTSYVPSFELAQIEMGGGNAAGALACLEHAGIRRESYCILLKVWPSFRPLRAEYARRRGTPRN
jgi:TolB-like protein